MKNIAKKLASLALGFALVLGVGISVGSSVNKEAIGVRAADDTTKNVSYTLSSKDNIEADDTFPFSVTYSGIWTWSSRQVRTTDTTATVTFAGNNSVEEITSIGIGCSSSSYAKAGSANNNYTTSVLSTTVKITGSGSSSITWTPGVAVRLKTINITYKLAETNDSISLTAGDQSISITEGESNSTLTYTATGISAESAILQSGTDVATFVLNDGAITINTTVGITGTGVYKLQKGTTLSENTITVVVNESLEPRIDFDLTVIDADALLLDEIYEIPYTLKNITNPAVTFVSSDENVMVKDKNNNLQIMTGSQTEITADTSFTVTYSVKDGDTEVISAQTLTLKVLVPTLTLGDDAVTVKIGKSVQVSFAYKNFGADTDTIIASSIQTGKDEIATTSVSGYNLVITGDTEGETIVDLTVTNGQRSLTKSISVTVQNAAKYNADTYVKLESDAVVEEGTYLLVYESSDTVAYVFNGKDATNDYVTATINSETIAPNGTVDAVKLLLTKNTDGTFYIQISGGINNGKYFSYSANNNGFNFTDNSIEKVKQTIAYDLTYGWLIKNTGGAAIRFNDADNQKRFRYYKNTGTEHTYTVGQKAICLYKLNEANTALGYAAEFKKALTTPCADPSANNQTKVEAVWNDLRARFSRLPTLVQTELKEGTSINATVIEALELYDHIVRRYVSETITDFMSRGIAPNASNMIYKSTDSNTAITIIVVVALISITAIGGYLFIRKCKHI